MEWAYAFIANFREEAWNQMDLHKRPYRNGHNTELWII